MTLNLAARNPEFRRQLWLEFSATRLLGMPAVLGLVFMAVALVGAGALAGIAQTSFVVLVWAYGARLASAALLDEVSEATWDAQRLSSLTAWQLTWGKLFGGTAYAWYGGLLSLAVWWAASAAQGGPLPVAAAISLVAGGVAVQAVSLIMALSAARRGAAGARRGGAWWVMILAALPLLGMRPFEGVGRSAVWWGLAIPEEVFSATMFVVFAGWAVLGAQRMMAAALQVPLRPMAWLGFQVWIALFAAGFGPLQSGLWRFAIALALVASTSAYVTLVIEPPRLDLWQRFAARWRESGFSHATQQRMPLLVASLALTLGGGLLASVMASWSALTATERVFGAAGMPLTIALLTLRDLALACALHWSPGIRRADGATLVLLAVLNLVLPWLLLAAGAPTLAAWLQPLIGQWQGGAGVAADLRLSMGIAALQAAGAIAIARAFWQPPQTAAAAQLRA